MRKMPTIFVRDFADKGRIADEWHPDCLWVRDGEGVPTAKLDGTCCLVTEDGLWKRRELKDGQERPAAFMLAEHDNETGKTVGWIPVTHAAEDRWHCEAIENSGQLTPGTYELIGPKVQGGKHANLHHGVHVLERHGRIKLSHVVDCGWTKTDIRIMLESDKLAEYEGIVFHHPDGRMAKIKKRDFGIPW